MNLLNEVSSGQELSKGLFCVDAKLLTDYITKLPKPILYWLRKSQQVYSGFQFSSEHNLCLKNSLFAIHLNLEHFSATINLREQQSWR